MSVRTLLSVAAHFWPRSGDLKVFAGRSSGQFAEAWKRSRRARG